MRTLIKAILITGGGSFVAMLLGALTTKIIAVVLGASGIGVYGQLRQIGQWLVILATVNGQVSLTQGLASIEEKKQFSISVALVFFIGAIVVGGFIFSFPRQFSELLFSTSDSDVVLAVRLLSIVVFLGVAASFVNGLINGHREIRYLAIIQVVSAFIMAVFAYPLALFGHPVAYVCLIASGHAVAVLLGSYFICRHKWLSFLSISELTPKYSYLKQHLSFAFVFLITGLIGSGTSVIIRALYIQNGGLDSGGLFDAAWTLSMMYVMLFLSSFGTYYIPTLSGLTLKDDIQNLVNQAFRLATLIGTVLVSFVVVFKPTIITILYSDAFMQSHLVLQWMLIGDFFKITGWVFGAFLIAFAERKVFLYSEVIFNGFILFTVFMWITDDWEIVGAAFMISSLFYLVYVWMYVKKKYSIRLENKRIVEWFLGLSIILFLSIVNWGAVATYSVQPLLMWVILSFLYLFITISYSELQSAISWVKRKSHND